MKSKKLELIDIQSREGGMALTFRYGERRAHWTVPFERVPMLIQGMAGVMSASGLGIDAELEEALLLPAVETPRMGLTLKGWPFISLRLNWTQLRALSQAAWSALANAPPDHPRSTS